MANAKFIKNKKGQKVSVVLDIKEYERLMEQQEELDSTRFEPTMLQKHPAKRPFRMNRF